MSGCGCGGNSGTAGTAGAPSSGPLLSGVLDARFAGDSGLAPLEPATESVADGGFSFASLSALPGGIWTAVLFVAAVGYTVYSASRKGE